MPVDDDDRLSQIPVFRKPGRTVEPYFERYLGIDYSGAGHPDKRLKGLRVFASERGQTPKPVGDRWSRRGLAEYLLDELKIGPPTIVGVDHAFSLPEKYFEDQKVRKNWDSLLKAFSERWKMTEPDSRVLKALGEDGNGSRGIGYTRLKRRTELPNKSKSVFHFNVPGQVACSTHAGIPWLTVLREELRGRVHFWPFDGWAIPRGMSAMSRSIQVFGPNFDLQTARPMRRTRTPSL